jgi:hypothetical protein
MDENVMTDFDQARALILSHHTEDAADDRLPRVLMQVREICGLDSFNRILVLAAAIEDHRYEEYGLADVLPLLSDLEVTADLRDDVERLLEAMRKEDAAVEAKARHEASELADPYRRAAVRLLRKFRSPTLEQALFELTRL